MKEQETSVRTFKGALGDLRVYREANGKDWFYLSDVAKALRISTPSTMRNGMHWDGVARKWEETTSGKVTTTTVIDEMNLYRWIFRCRKKEAEVFQIWVVKEVLPILRGEIITPAEPKAIGRVCPVLYKGEWLYDYEELLKEFERARRERWELGEDITMIFQDYTKEIQGRVYVTKFIVDELERMEEEEKARAEARREGNTNQIGG